MCHQDINLNLNLIYKLSHCGVSCDCIAEHVLVYYPYILPGEELVIQIFYPGQIVKVYK